MSGAIRADEAAILHHLTAVYGDWDSGTLSLFPKDTKQTERFDASQPDALRRMAERAAVLANDGRDVHFNVQVMRADIGERSEYARGRVDEVHAVTGFIADVDVGKPGTPPTREAAREFFEESLPSPTLIVNSGGGYHLYYLLHEPFLIETEAERAMLSGMAKGVTLLVNQRAESFGWKFDQEVGELARVLRPAGALHRKDPDNTRPVVMVQDDGPRYSLDDIQELLPEDFGASKQKVGAPAEGDKPIEDHRHDALLRAFEGAWVDGKRHHMGLYATGFLANTGYSEAATSEFIAQASKHFGDRDTEERLRSVRDTYALVRRGLRPGGYSELMPLLSEEGRRVFRTHFPPSVSGVAATVPGAEHLPPLPADEQHFPTITIAAWERLKAYNDKDPANFLFGNTPTRIGRGENNEPIPQELDVDRLRNEMASATLWDKWSERRKERVPASPPSTVMRNMLAERSIPLPSLRGIVEAPVFAPNGDLSLDPGYNRTSRLFYVPHSELTSLSVPATRRRPCG